MLHKDVLMMWATSDDAAVCRVAYAFGLGKVDFVRHS